MIDAGRLCEILRMLAGSFANFLMTLIYASFTVMVERIMPIQQV